MPGRGRGVRASARSSSCAGENRLTVMVLPEAAVRAGGTSAFPGQRTLPLSLGVLPAGPKFSVQPPKRCDNFAADSWSERIRQDEPADFSFWGSLVKLVSSRFILSVGAVIVFSLSAQASYTAGNVKGNYSILMDAWTAATQTNSALLGMLTFDGVSVVTGFVTVVNSTGPQTYTIESGSTYTVQSSGSGSISLVTTEGTVPLDFVLNSVSAGVAQGLQLLYINPIGGNVVNAGTAIAMNLAGSASAATLKGNYSFLSNSWTADPSASQMGLVGTMMFNGAGKVAGSYTQEKDGVSSSSTFSGTYSVSSDGSGSMIITADENIQTIDFVLNSVVKSVADSLQFLAADSTMEDVSTGTAVRQ